MRDATDLSATRVDEDGTARLAADARSAERLIIDCRFAFARFVICMTDALVNSLALYIYAVTTRMKVYLPKTPPVTRRAERARCRRERIADLFPAGRLLRAASEKYARLLSLASSARKRLGWRGCSSMMRLLACCRYSDATSIRGGQAPLIASDGAQPTFSHRGGASFAYIFGVTRPEYYAASRCAQESLKGDSALHLIFKLSLARPLARTVARMPRRAYVTAALSRFRHKACLSRAREILLDIAAESH